MSITIGIPFYNAELYLADAIRSIFAQTYQDWELILVDDGSTDRSLEIAHSVRDSRVRVISDGENRRLAGRLNQITSEAKYELIGRMDADDLISPTRFARQIEALNINPELDLVTTGICSITEDNRPVAVRVGQPGNRVTGRKLLMGKTAIAHAAILGRRSWFLRNQYNVSINRIEDYELWLRAFSKNDLKIGFLHEPLYYYREEGNVTPKRLLVAYAGLRKLYVKYGYLGFHRAEIPLRVGQSFSKSLIVQILSAFGKMDILLKNRSKPITDSNLMEKLIREINQVRSTKVPGLD